MNSTATYDPTRVSLGILIFFISLVMASAAWLLEYPMLIPGLIYMAGFAFLAFQQPSLALALTCALAPFQSDVGAQGIKFSLAEVNVLVLFLIYLFQVITKRKRLSFTPPWIPVTLYLAICIASAFYSWQGNVAVLSIAQMIEYFTGVVLVFGYLAPSTTSLVSSLKAIVGIGVVIGIIGPLTHFNFLGMSKNGLGASLSCAVIVAIELWIAEKNQNRRMLYLGSITVIVIGLLFSLSRGSWIGATVGILIILGLRRRFKLMFQASLFLIPLLAVCWMFIPEDSKAYATSFDTSRMNIRTRLTDFEVASAYFHQNIWIGSGIGIRKLYDATNVVMTVLAETGIVGLIPFSAIYVSIWRMVWKLQKVIRPTDPDFTLLTICVALVFRGLAHGMVDHYWGRGPLTLSWAAVGMATAVYVKYFHGKSTKSPMIRVTK